MKGLWKKRKLSGTHGIAFGLAMALLIYPTPVRSAVSDNLGSAVALILGEKADTTEKASYENATVCAKLNFLQDEVEEIRSAQKTSAKMVKAVYHGVYDIKQDPNCEVLIVVNVEISSGISQEYRAYVPYRDRTNKEKIYECMKAQNSNFRAATPDMMYKITEKSQFRLKDNTGVLKISNCNMSRCSISLTTAGSIVKFPVISATTATANFVTDGTFDFSTDVYYEVVEYN